MSEQDNVRIVREAYEAFLRGDIPGVMKNFAQDIEWIVPGPGVIPYAGRRRGLEEIGKFFTSVGQTTELNPFEPREYIAQGDRVVVLGHYGGRVKTTGKPIKSEWAMAWTVRNGKIVRFQEYTDTADLAAAFKG